MSANKITLSLVINGSTTSFDFAPSQPLHAVIAETLGRTGNTGRPPADWNATNAAGDALDRTKSLSALGLSDGAVVFLTASVGVGG